MKRWKIPSFRQSRYRHISTLRLHVTTTVSPYRTSARFHPTRSIRVHMAYCGTIAPTRATARRKRIRRANRPRGVDTPSSSKRIRRPGEPFTAPCETRCASFLPLGQDSSSRVGRLRNGSGSLSHSRRLLYLHWTARLTDGRRACRDAFACSGRALPGDCRG